MEYQVLATLTGSGVIISYLKESRMEESRGKGHDVNIPIYRYRLGTCDNR